MRVVRQRRSARCTLGAVIPPSGGAPPPPPPPPKGAREVTKERQGTTIATHLVEFRDHGQLKLTHDEGSKRVQGDGKEGERNTGMKHTAGEYLCCSSKGCMLHITGQQLCQVQLGQAYSCGCSKAPCQGPYALQPSTGEGTQEASCATWIHMQCTEKQLRHTFW